MFHTRRVSGHQLIDRGHQLIDCVLKSKTFYVIVLMPLPPPRHCRPFQQIFYSQNRFVFIPIADSKLIASPKIVQDCNQSINLFVESPPNINKSQQFGVFVLPRRGQKKFEKVRKIFERVRKPKRATFCRQIPSSFCILISSDWAVSRI